VPSLSFNSKGLHTFDKTRNDCFDSCDINLVCFMNHNLQLKINAVYINKIKNNDKLIRSSKFVKVITNELKFKNGGIAKLRFFSNGDFNQDIKISDIEINNIFKLAKTNQFKQFWITTRNFNALFSYIPTHKIPNNLNIMFSTPIKPNQFFIDFCKKYKIQLSEIVLTQKESNCPSSINRKSCIKNKCEKCFNYSSEVRKFHIHGKGNKEKLKEIYNNVD